MDIVDLYLEHGDFRTAVRLSGLPMHIAHIKLRKAGVRWTSRTVVSDSST
jgi:hypothetical protein